MFAQLGVGSCLAYDADRAVYLVPCSGPHSAEVSRSEDLTTRFPTMPTFEQFSALSDELCPAAGRAWTGGDEPSYATGYYFRFDS